MSPDEEAARFVPSARNPSQSLGVVAPDLPDEIRWSLVEWVGKVLEGTAGTDLRQQPLPLFAE
jgi:hypothetical protein